jgi:hypothetical protein
MLSKEDKIKLILDIKRGRITKNIVNVLKNDIVILLDKKSFCKDYNLPLNEFDEIYNYIQNNGRWHIVGLENNQ